MLPHDALVELLQQARDGEDPDVLLVELYANSDDGDEDVEEVCGWADPDTLARWVAAACISAAVTVVCAWWVSASGTRRVP